MRNKDLREKLIGVVPFEYVHWGPDECAAYFDEDKYAFLQTRRHMDGFPPEIPGKPRRWRALAVTQWALGIQEAA